MLDADIVRYMISNPTRCGGEIWTWGTKYTTTSTGRNFFTRQRRGGAFDRESYISLNWPIYVSRQLNDNLQKIKSNHFTFSNLGTIIVNLLNWQILAAYAGGVNYYFITYAQLRYSLKWGIIYIVVLRRLVFCLRSLTASSRPGRPEKQTVLIISTTTQDWLTLCSRSRGMANL